MGRRAHRRHPRPQSYLRDCHIDPRPGETGPLFDRHPDGSILARLDGYAIVPKDHYYRLYRAQGEVEETHWPCKGCGAVSPTPEGHDPCIANIPGVVHACCGHGTGHGYVMFEDGRTIRGWFEQHLEPIQALPVGTWRVQSTEVQP